MILYPNGTCYTKLTPEAIPEIVARHMQYDEPVSKLVREDVGVMKGRDPRASPEVPRDAEERSCGTCR